MRLEDRNHLSGRFAVRSGSRASFAPQRVSKLATMEGPGERIEKMPMMMHTLRHSTKLAGVVLQGSRRFPVRDVRMPDTMSEIRPDTGQAPHRGARKLVGHARRVIDRKRCG
jgi:hypothetical protein